MNWRRTIGILLLNSLRLNAFAQNDNVDFLINSTGVELRTEDGAKGSGFIIGVAKDSIYIVTAKHVITNVKDKDRMFVKLFNEPGQYILTIKFISQDTMLDIALVAMKRQRYYPWNKPDISEDLNSRETLFFQHLNGGRELIGLAEESHLVSRSRTEKRYYLDINPVRPGDSGSALYKVGNGIYIVGMLIQSGETSCAIPITYIKKLIHTKFPDLWQL